MMTPTKMVGFSIGTLLACYLVSLSETNNPVLAFFIGLYYSAAGIIIGDIYDRHQ